MPIKRLRRLFRKNDPKTGMSRKGLEIAIDNTSVTAPADAVYDDQTVRLFTIAAVV